MRIAFACAALMLCVSAIGYARWEIFRYYEAQSSLEGYAGRMAVVEGTVASDPDQRATSLQATLSVKEINGQKARGLLLALLPRETEVAYGDTVKVRGLIELPEAFETDTGRVFDYLGYLRVRGISMMLQRGEMREQVPGGFSIIGSLYAVKHWFEHSLERIIPEPEASLLEGMLLGERGGFDKDLLQAFVVAGLIHIVVLSGSNIAVVSEGAFRLLGALPFLRRRYVFLIGFGVIVLFALMTGGGAATVRAVIMGSIAILARYLRRPGAALRSLGVAAVLMVLWNPLVLIHDNGFILSVLATFGLITLSPWFESKLAFLPAWGKGGFRSVVATTLAVEAFILPALLYFSGVLSFISIPANALVLPLVPLVMLVGFIAGVLGLVHPWIAFFPALLAELLLKLIIWITETGAGLPFASTIVAPFPWWVAVLAYVPLTAWAIAVYRRSASPTPSSSDS